MTTWLQVVEVGLKYSKTIASIFVFVISFCGYGIYDYGETKKNIAVQEVAIGFQQVMTEVQLVKEIEPRVIRKFSCDSCKALWIKDIEKATNGLERKYHR